MIRTPSRRNINPENSKILTNHSKPLPSHFLVKQSDDEMFTRLVLILIVQCSIGPTATSEVEVKVLHTKIFYSTILTELSFINTLKYLRKMQPKGIWLTANKMYIAGMLLYRTNFSNFRDDWYAIGNEKKSSGGGKDYDATTGITTPPA